MYQNNPQDYLDKALLIHDQQAVNQAISTIALQLNADYATEPPLVLCVMGGGVFLTGQLL
jgi:hypoxanthine phosphoribosyltransferase